MSGFIKSFKANFHQSYQIGRAMRNGASGIRLLNLFKLLGVLVVLIIIVYWKYYN